METPMLWMFFGVYGVGVFIGWGGWQFYLIHYETLDDEEKASERRGFLFILVWTLLLKAVSLLKVFTSSEPSSLTQFEMSLIVLAGLPALVIGALLTAPTWMPIIVLFSIDVGWWKTFRRVVIFILCLITMLVILA